MSTTGTKTIKGRISNKHNTEENWILSVYTSTNKTTLRDNPFIPLEGELIIYDPDDVYTRPRLKVGDGTQNVVALPFAEEAYTLASFGVTATATELNKLDGKNYLQLIGSMTAGLNLNLTTIEAGVYDIDNISVTNGPVSGKLYGTFIQFPGDYKSQLFVAGGSGLCKLYTRRYLAASNSWTAWLEMVTPDALEDYQKKIGIIDFAYNEPTITIDENGMITWNTQWGINYGETSGEATFAFPISAGDNISFTSSGNEVIISAESTLPASSATNEGQFLRVVGGVPAWSTVPNAEGTTF